MSETILETESGVTLISFCGPLKYAELTKQLGPYGIRTRYQITTDEGFVTLSVADAMALANALQKAADAAIHKAVEKSRAKAGKADGA